MEKEIKCIPVRARARRGRAVRRAVTDALELLAGMATVVMLGCLAGAGMTLGAALMVAWIG